MQERSLNERPLHERSREVRMEPVGWMLIAAVGLYAAYRLGVIDGRREGRNRR